MRKQLALSDYIKDKKKQESLIKWLAEYGNDGEDLPVEWDIGDLGKGVMLGKIVRSFDNTITTYQEKCYRNLTSFRKLLEKEGLTVRWSNEGIMSNYELHLGYMVENLQQLSEKYPIKNQQKESGIIQRVKDFFTWKDPWITMMNHLRDNIYQPKFIDKKILENGFNHFENYKFKDLVKAGAESSSTNSYFYDIWEILSNMIEVNVPYTCCCYLRQIFIYAILN